ncbi:MAG: carboxypeptidase-like regulatory domain-containing protein, partial [Muribaculaceae bacterium]|nr:carboxypeptidase-like regulatory domain-containing protein [Muribaculaceae bacterium]
MKRYTIFIIIFLLGVFTMAAKGPVKISGTVTDDQNEGLEFVTVKIQGTAIGTITGAGGKYTLTAPEADTIRVVFTCIGFEESKRRLIDASGDVTVNVKMSPASYALGAVEVTDYQKQTSGMQKIDNGNYRLAPDVTGGSVEALISTMAGVSSSNEMSSQYSVRGGSYDENSVYINGIEVYRPQLISSGQQEGLSIVNPDMVGAIGFSTGGFTAQYADRMSSVLDITYRQPEAFEGSVSASLMGASAAIGSSSKVFSQLHGLRYKQNSSLLGSLDDKGEYDPRFFDYQTSMTLKLGEKWSVSALGNIAVNNYKFIPHNRSTKFGTSTDAKEFTVYFDGQEKDRFETYFGAATINFKPSKKAEFALQAGGFFTNELVSYDISGEYWLDQAGTSGSDGNEGIGGELGVGRYHEHARNRFKASVFNIALKGATGLRRHNLNYGIDFKHETLYDRSREWELRDSAGFSLPADPDAVKVIYNLSSNNDLSTNRFAAYINDTYRLETGAGYFNINAGLRLSYWDFNKETLVSPRASVGFVPSRNPRLALRLATGLYYQTPFFKEFRLPETDADGNVVISLNSDIKSQRSFQLIFGADYTFRAFNRPFKISGEAYYKALS